MFLVLEAVFSLVFRSTRTYKIDLLIGLFLYDFFSETTKTGMVALHNRGFLLSKAQFPSWILVVTAISNPLITVAVFCAAIVVTLHVIGQPPGAAAVTAFVAYILAMAVIGTGISLAGSVLFLRYRDLNQVWDVVVQAGFFVAPIIYPIGVIPERFHYYLYLWPPTAVIEFSRSVLIDGHIPTVLAHVDLAFVTVMILTVSAFIYRRLAPRAAEYL
jgi:lipopolysaccharide transport system permease protein